MVQQDDVSSQCVLNVLTCSVRLAAGHDAETLLLVLVGPKGSGKSSAGNIILGKEAFKTGTRTLTCQTESCKMEGHSVTVMDTPSLTGKETTDQEVMRTITKAAQDLCETLAVFLVVVPLEWNEKKSQGRQQGLKHALGQVSADYRMVLITHVDQVQREGTNEEGFLRKGGLLQQNVDQCGGWFHLFNIAETDRTQISELLEKMDRMMLEGERTPDELMEEAEKLTEDQTQDYRAAISFQKKRVQKRIEVIKNSERIIAENKDLLRRLREEIDGIEEELRATVSEVKKQALSKRIQEKAKDIEAKEEKIVLHIGVLQTLQQQVEEKQQHISEMEKNMKDREKEHARTTTHHPKTKDGTSDMGSDSCTVEKDYDKRTGMDVTPGGMFSLRKNLQELEKQKRVEKKEDEELERERNSKYKAQLQNIKQKGATH